MNVAVLVEELEAAGLELWEDAGRLRFRGPKGALTPERREALTDHRDAVVAHLRGAPPAATVTPCPQERHEPFPLTDVQSAYLLGRRDVFAYGGVACHAYGELSYDELDPERLQAAWNALVARHDMLRAVVDLGGSQRVLEQVAEYEIPVVDLRGRRPDDVEAVLEAVRDDLDHEVHAPGEWPLFSLRVTHCDDGALLHVSIDFLIADYVSIYVLLDELDTLYQDPAAELPDLELSFRDYLAAERAVRRGPAYERDRAYWAERLDDLHAPELPVLDAGGQTGPVRFRRHQVRLDAARWDALKRAATGAGVTASGGVLAAYAEVIGRWSRQPRFTLDLTLLSRLPLHPDVGRVVGDFTSVELLAVDPADGDTFADRARALAGRLFSDLDHRLFTGVEVMREIARRRGPDAALMPVVFTSALGLGGADAAGSTARELGHGISQTPQVWIDCQVMEHGGELSINWDVRDGVFPDGVVEDMVAAFTELLGLLAGGPDAWEAADPVALPTRQGARRAAVNDTAVPPPTALLHDGIVARAGLTPDAPAVVTDDEVLSFADLLGRAAAVAARLRAAGTTPGEIVGVVLQKGPAQVVAALGVLLAGGAYLPVDTRQPAGRRADILRDAGVRHVLVGDGVALDLPDGVDAHAVRSDVADPAALPPAVRGPDDLAYVIYTSGSTGRPKGVMISHRGAVNTLRDLTRRFDLGARDRVLGLAALGFDLSVFDVFGVPAAGGALVLPDPARGADPAYWAALVERHAVTVWNTVPAQMQMLADYLRSSPETLDTLRLAMLSGDWIPTTLPAALRGRLPGVRQISLGGATEASIWSIWHPISPADDDRPSVPYGTPLENQRFHVLDPAGRPCPDWVAGELYIGGTGVALGYLGDAERTAERFVTRPGLGRLYRTGDMGRYHPSGVIEFLGREDRQVKLRGFRVELAEVEAALVSDPDVASAAVLVEGATSAERRLAAFVEPRRHDDPAEDLTGLVSGVAGSGAALRRPEADAKVVEFARHLDRTALLVMVDTFRSHGLFACPADRHDVDEIVDVVGVAEKHRRLVRRWLAALVTEGLFAVDDDRRYRALVEVAPDDVTDAWATVEELLPGAHDRPELVRYFQLAARRLTELLRDEQDPIQLLFPDGNMDIHIAAYSEGLLSRYLNTVTTSALQALARRHAGAEPLRLLEVGAGVGGTSIEAVPALDGLGVAYTFTDVSQFFLNKAAERFADLPWVDYALFDMNEPYREQGMPPNSVDVILCGNVMHYSKDARLVLARMRELLRPGGWLVFIETTRDNYQLLTSMEFLFDATNGDFEDVRRGRDQTFVGRDQWVEMLTGAGAEVVFCLPDGDDAFAEIGMHVFAARFKTDRVALAPDDVRTRMLDRVPPEMVPAAVHIVDGLPLTENGKVDGATLEAWLPGEVRAAPGSPAGTSGEGPSGELEQALGAIWAEVLRIRLPGRDEDFYALGGDSLLAAQVATEIRERVPAAADTPTDELLRELLGGATVARLARALGGAGGPDPGSAESAVDGAAPADGLVLEGAPAGDGTPVAVLVEDGLGGEAGRWAAALGADAPFVRVRPTDVTGRDQDTLVTEVADEVAAGLLALSPGPFRIVGAHLGGVLAVEIARNLSESGARVVDVTAVSSYPLPAVVSDPLLRAYLYACDVGEDPQRFGFPDDDQVGTALAAVLEQTPRHVPEGSMDACFGAMAAVDADERIGAMADALGRPADGLRAALERSAALGAAFARHRPEPYVGDVTVLVHRSDTPLWPRLAEDTLRFWEDLCLGEMYVREIAGDHFGCRSEWSVTT